MKTSTKCPKCGSMISFWGIARQFTMPTHIKCRGCKARLKVSMRGIRVFIVLEIAMYFVLLGLIVLAALWSQSNFMKNFIWLILGLVGYGIVEIGAALLYINYGELTPRQQKKK